MEKDSLMNDTNNRELVGFCFVSSLNFVFLGRLPSDTILLMLWGTSWGKKQDEMYKSIAAALSLALLEHGWVSSEKPIGEFLFVQSCSSNNTTTAKLIKSVLVEPSVKYKIIFVTKNVLETHPASTPAQADECTSQVAA